MNESVTPRGNVCDCCPARYVLAILASFAIAILYILKVHFHLAIVAMVNHTAVTGNNSTNQKEDGPFVWSESLQGVLLSCYYWGYLVTQIPGGRLAEKVSAKWVLFFAATISIVCTLLMPPFAKIHFIGILIMRVIEGAASGVTYPAVLCILAAWAPRKERTFMSAIVHLGAAIGPALAIFSAGILITAYGWESVFYVLGGSCTIWIFFWVILIQDHPNKQPYITQEERDYILEDLHSDPAKNRPPIPWKSIMKSLPFWAIFVAHGTTGWGASVCVIELPTYFKSILKLNFGDNALFFAVPFVTWLCFSVSLGKTLDTLITKNIITVTTSRKFATTLGMLAPASCLTAACFGNNLGNPKLVMTLIIIAITLSSAVVCGFFSNHVDISPNFAGTIMATTNMFSTTTGIAVPLFVGFITEGNQTIDAWRTVFIVTIVFYVFGVIFYCIFATSEEQPWNNG